jgi:hypothetical protein
MLMTSVMMAMLMTVVVMVVVLVAVVPVVMAAVVMLAMVAAAAAGAVAAFRVVVMVTVLLRMDLNPTLHRPGDGSKLLQQTVGIRSCKAKLLCGKNDHRLLYLGKGVEFPLNFCCTVGAVQILDDVGFLQHDISPYHFNICSFAHMSISVYIAFSPLSTDFSTHADFLFPRKRPAANFFLLQQASVLPFVGLCAVVYPSAT